MEEKKKPLRKLEDFKLPEIGKLNKTKPKTTQEVNQFDNTSKLSNEAKTVNQFDNSLKLEKEGKSVDSMPQTPMKIGKDFIPYDRSVVNKILETSGKDVSPLSQTPEKTTEEVNLFDNSSKLDTEAKDVQPLSQTPEKTGKDVERLTQTPQKKTVDVSPLVETPQKQGFSPDDLSVTPEKTTPDISPFNSLGNFEKLSSFSPNDRDKISEVDFLQNEHAKGFVKNFNEGNTTKYTESPSDLTLGSDLDNREFNSNNKYLDDLNGKPNGNFPSKQQELTKNSTNPLLTTHWEDIGLPTPGSNNLTQAVDFLGGSNSYFEAISPEIPGFTQSPLLKQTLFGEENFQQGISLSNMGRLFPPLVTSGITPAILDGDPEGSNFDDGNGNITTAKYDPRPEFFGVPSFTLMGHQNKNQYEGSIFDELVDMQFNPFFNDVENYENIATNAMMTDFTDVSSLTENYQYQIFDPREERLGVLPTGQTDIKFPNPKNTYEGTKFDDPLVDGVEGGGRFNTSAPSQKYSNVFRTINTPTLQQIIENGFGHPGAVTAEQLYSETGGVFSGTNSEFENGTTPTPYTDNTMIIGESPEGQGTIDLSSTWYFGNNPFPVTNNILNESFEGENETRTINVNLESLAGNRLGFSDLVHDTIYGDEANPDSRLTYTYTNSGDRGEEPYVVVNIPDNFTDSRITSDLFTFNFSGQSNRKGGAFDDGKKRVESFLTSPKGEDFVNNMIRLHSLNPRSARVFNSSALTDSYQQSKPLGFKQSSGFPLAFIGGPDGSYTKTLYEKTLGHPLLLGPPNGIVGDGIDTLLLNTNGKFRFSEDGEETPGFFGNVFQVTGFFNPMGLTIRTNVSPQQQSMGDILGENLGNLFSILQTQSGFSGQTIAGGIGELGNPRGLTYKEGAPLWAGLTNLLVKLFNKDDGNAILNIKPGNAAPEPSLDDHKSFTDKNIQTFVNADSESTKQDRFSNLENVDLKPYRSLIPPTDGAIAPLRNLSVPEKYEDKTTDKIPQSLESHRIKSHLYPTEHYDGYGTPEKTLISRGDFYTLLPIRHGDGINIYDETNSDGKKPTQSVDLGYPFYFKDMRDNAYVFFRGFIDGLNETLTAEWSEQSYLGRSENSYTYKKGSRSISFNLNLFAQSRDELNMIYDKLQKLSSMVYPMYKNDYYNFQQGQFTGGKSRMKPPLCKIRIGDLYGSDDNELLGWVESVTYTFPENNTWEHTPGSRVPKSIQAAITYRVLHKDAPSMFTKFFGKALTHQINKGKPDDMVSAPNPNDMNQIIVPKND